MNCWHCDRPSHGSCFFCGRGVCKEHARTMPGVLELFRDRGNSLRGMVVDTVLWCGVCNPKRYPVNLDVIDPAPLIEPSRKFAADLDTQDDVAIRDATASSSSASTEAIQPPPGAISHSASASSSSSSTESTEPTAAADPADTADTADTDLADAGPPLAPDDRGGDASDPAPDARSDRP